MTPREKAKQLIGKMSFSKSKAVDFSSGDYNDVPSNQHAKECALECVNEILGVIRDTSDEEVYETWLYYYEQVKREIEIA